MASKDLETRLIATDKASKVIEQVADDLDRLEKKGDVEVELTAKDKASDDIRELDRRLAGLSDEDKTIVLRAQAKDAQRDIDRILRSLRDVDKVDDETVKIRIEALGDARTELHQIQEQVDKLDREKVDIPVDVDNRTTSKFAQLKTDLAGAETGMGKLGVLGQTAFASLGQFAVPALATAGAAVGTFLTKAVTGFEDLALEVGKASDSLGLTADQASRLHEITGDIGISFDAVTTTLKKMNISAANTPAAFDAIGASIAKSDDGTTDVQQTFLNVIDALNAIPDATQRAAAAQAIFGRGWTQISELISMGADNITAAMADVEGAKLIDPAEIKKAKDMRAAMDDLHDKIEEVQLSAGEALLPVFVKLAGMATDVLDAFTGLSALLSGDAFKGKFWKESVKGGHDLLGINNDLQEQYDREIKQRGALNDVVLAGIDLAVQAADASQGQADALDTTAANAARAGIELARINARFEEKAKIDEARAGLDASRQAAELQNLADIRSEQADVLEQTAQLAQGMIDYQDTIDSLDWKNLEAGKGAIEGAVSAWEQVTSARFGLDTIFSNTEDAWDNLADTLKTDSGKIRMDWDLTTDRGRAINQAMQDLAGTMTARVAAAFKESGGKWQDFRKEMEATRLQTIARLMDDFGLSAEAAENMADKIVGIPKDWKTTYELSGIEEAQTKIGLLQTAIDDLPDNVKTKVTQEIIAGDYVAALKTVQDYYDQNHAKLTVDLVVGAVDRLLGPGLGLGVGVGGTAVTSTAMTRTALPATSTAAPRTATATVPVVIHQTNNVNAATVGDPFDVMRAIEKANRRLARLMPVLP